jgi:hypothetical protein
MFRAVTCTKCREVAALVEASIVRARAGPTGLPSPTLRLGCPNARRTSARGPRSAAVSRRSRRPMRTRHLEGRKAHAGSNIAKQLLREDLFRLRDAPKATPATPCSPDLPVRIHIGPQREPLPSELLTSAILPRQ